MSVYAVTHVDTNLGHPASNIVGEVHKAFLTPVNRQCQCPLPETRVVTHVPTRVSTRVSIHISTVSGYHVSIHASTRVSTHVSTVSGYHVSIHVSTGIATPCVGPCSALGIEVSCPDTGVSCLDLCLPVLAWCLPPA